MSHRQNETLLEVLLDSWDRNNSILINLLHLVPESGKEVSAGPATWDVWMKKTQP